MLASFIQANARHKLSDINIILGSNVIHKRNITTTHLDPAIRRFTSALAEKQPCFSMSSRDIRVLFTPQEFYCSLLDMIRRARTRIFLSSLYIGAEEGELIGTVKDALERTPSLQVDIHLDLNRSTRPENPSTAQALLPLLLEYPERVHVYLFRSPRLKGLMAKLVPPRFNEGWGTWHSKIYGVDEEVIISGANLNKSYFTNRQDRYIHFKDHPGFAQYCRSFLSMTARFSYALRPSSSSSSAYELLWPDPHIHPQHIERKAGQALSQFQLSHLPSNPTSIASKDDQVLVFPIIQAGQFDVREEERCLALLFDHLSRTPERDDPPAHRSSIDLTSGYFGLYRPYQDLILKASVGCRIVTASPRANGFYGSKGLSGRIPEGYTYLEQRFMRAVRAEERSSLRDVDVDAKVSDSSAVRGVQLSEWEREGWTYHAKGIWLSPSHDAPPILTLVGSTNLNSRSSNLDTELSFVMVSASPDLRRQLQDELEGLRKFSKPWKGAERKVRMGTKLLVGAVGGML